MILPKNKRLQKNNILDFIISMLKNVLSTYPPIIFVKSLKKLHCKIRAEL